LNEPRLAPIVALDAVRLKTLLPRVVSRCMSFSAVPAFDASLVAAVQAFYGIDVDVATAETEILEDDLERVRFFPWFLWDWQAPGGGPTVGTCFAAESDLGAEERRLADALNASCVWFWEVVAVATGDEAGVTLREILGTQMIDLRDAALAEGVRPGDVLQARVVSVARADGEMLHLLDAVYVCLPAVLAGTLPERLLALVGPGETLTSAMRKAMAPELIELAEEIVDVGLHGDDAGEPLLLCWTRIANFDPHIFGACLAFDAGTGAWRLEDDFGHVVGVIEPRGDGHARLYTVGREDFDAAHRMVTMLGVQTAPMHASSDLETTLGRWVEEAAVPTWVASHPDLLPAVSETVSAWVRLWPGLVHTSLGRRPVDALRDPEGRADVDRLIAAMARGVPPACAEPFAEMKRQLGLD
jgi:hypothetical protein